MSHDGEKRRWDRYVSGAPAGPGVYVMRDGRGKVLYVGKAKSLRVRIRSYRDPRGQTAKTSLFLHRVRDVSCHLTDTEVEALILENSLIKKLKPRYNISLRDDKTYPFLRLSVHEEYPTLSVVRRPGSDGAKYFGPYVPAGAMRRTLRLLRKIIPLRRCGGKIDFTRERPCLNHQMGRCLAPCVGRASREEYAGAVRSVLLFLQGKGKELADDLRRTMKDAAGRQDYETAALYRDRIEAIESVLAKQKVHLPGRKDMDVVGTVHMGERWAAGVIHGSSGRIIGVRKYSFSEKIERGGEEEALSQFLRVFYGRTDRIPPLIAVPVEPEGIEALKMWLSGRKGTAVDIRVPRSGLLKSLVAMASKNALQALEKESAPALPGSGLLGELARITGISESLSSLVAIDASSLGGSDAVASSVWWQEGAFLRRNYRRFRFASDMAADDYAMIADAVGRFAARVGGEKWQSPDVVMVDGGRGQLSAAGMALEKCGVWYPKLLVSMAKPHKGRRTDTVYAAGCADAVPLEKGGALLKLLQMIRDEAHRSAITYHRNVRSARGRRSFLDGVTGVGPARKLILLKRFGSLAALRKASKKELLDVPGLPAPVAEDLFDALRDGETR